MRIAETADLGELQTVYQAATSYANQVGTIDWPDPIPEPFVAELIASSELHCFEDERHILAAVKLSRTADDRVWGNTAAPALYVAKLATDDRARSSSYFRTTMLPAITEYAGPTTPLRLDCLADNRRLKDFYSRLGFVGLGDATFFSVKQQRPLTVTRFERFAEV